MAIPYNAKGSYKWVILTISFLLMLTFAISLQALPPMFNLITKDIPFSNSQAGMLMGAYAIPGIFLPFLVAFMAKQFNQKMMIIIALLIMFFGLIAFSISGSFISLLISRLVAGIGATVLVVLAPLLITMFFDKKNIGIAMGVFNVAVPFGTVLAANLFGILGLLMEWRLIILGIAVFIGVVLVVNIFALSLPNNRDHQMNSHDTQEKTQPMYRMGSGLWVLALIWALANAQLLAYVTFGPQYFQTVGLSIESAGLFTSFIMLVPIFLSPLVGIIIDKTGLKKQLLLIGSTIMAISFIFISKVSLILAWAIILGIGFTPIPVIVFSLLPEIVDPHQIGAGLGVLTAFANLGITIGPAAFGVLLDITAGRFFIGFILLALVSVGIVILNLAGLKRRRGKSTL